MTRATIFKSNRSQAVCLPKAVAFPRNIREVAIVREGERRIIVPADRSWDDFFDRPGIDLVDRVDQPAQAREAF